MYRAAVRAGALVILCLALLCSFAPGSAAAADEPQMVRVGAYENPPKIFTDENGFVSGFWGDIVTYIAGEENWQVEYVHGSWTECLERLERGEIDMMPDVAYTVERSQAYAFPEESVYTSWSMVYVREGSSIQSVLDLEGKTVAVLKGSVNVEGPNGIKELVKAFNVNCLFLEVGSYGEGLARVAGGDADAGVVSKDHGYRHSGGFGLVETPIVFQPSQLYFAFPKDGELTSHLIAVTDHHIRTLRETSGSVYYQSLATWFAQEPVAQAVIPSWLKLTSTGVLAIALILGAGSIVLRRRVAARTRELTAEVARRAEAEASLRESNAQREQMLQGTLGVVQQIVEVSDPYTSGHQRRVAELAVAIAREMGLPEEPTVHLMHTIGVIHDVGKTTVPSEILSKPGALSDAEFALVKTHSKEGHEIMRRANLPNPVAEVVWQHHERLDGSGYPRRLSGEGILPEARILAIADVVEAMSSFRPYRPSLGIDAALEEVTAGSGTRYDPDVVAACVRLFKEKRFAFSA